MFKPVVLSLAFAALGLGAPINPNVLIDYGNPGFSSWTGIGNVCGGMGISDAFIASQPDAFDCAARLRVAGVDYVAPNPSDFFNNIYTGGVVPMSGLDVSMQYYMFITLLRVSAIFTNPGFNPITTSFEFESNSGADSAMQFVATSSGDTLFSTADRWVVVDDNSTSGGDPSTVFILYGPGAANTPTGAAATTTFDSAGNQGVRSTFNVTVNPGQTVRFLFFIGLQETAADGIATAELLASGERLVSEMTAAELAEVANFRIAPVPEPSTYAMVAGGVVMAAVRRRMTRRTR